MRKALGVRVAGLLAMQHILPLTFYAFAGVNFLPTSFIGDNVAFLISFIIAGLGISVAILLIIGPRRHNECASDGDSGNYRCDFHRFLRW